MGGQLPPFLLYERNFAAFETIFKALIAELSYFCSRNQINAIYETKKTFAHHTDSR